MLINANFAKQYLANHDIQIGGSRPWDVQIHDSALLNDIAWRGTLAAGEGYVEGRWDCQALDELAHRLADRSSSNILLPSAVTKSYLLYDQMINRQSGASAKAVIQQHYDKETHVIEQIVGPSYCYSCAYWAEVDNLDDAQRAKLDLICKKLKLKETDRVLDIGCGYGAALRHVAENYGCEVVGITLSSRQEEHAKTWCESPRVTVHLMDWQSDDFDNLGTFDKILSIGMFEHVGLKNYRRFFQKCTDRLADHGLMLLHTIGRSVGSAFDPWVDKYVFPGGNLPMIEDLGHCSDVELVVEDLQNIGADYDHTLMAWERNLQQAHHEGRLGLNKKGVRFWQYYLLTFAGAFRSRRRIHVWQVLLAKNGVPGGYRR